MIRRGSPRGGSADGPRRSHGHSEQPRNTRSRAGGIPRIEVERARSCRACQTGNERGMRWNKFGFGQKGLQYVETGMAYTREFRIHSSQWTSRQRKPDSWIADQIGITKGQCICWRRAKCRNSDCVNKRSVEAHHATHRQSVRRSGISTRGTRPSGNRRKVMTSFKKACRTLVFLPVKSRNTSTLQHGVSPAPTHKAEPHASREPSGSGYSGINGWATPEGDAEFIPARGKEKEHHAVDIMARFGVGATRVQNQAIDAWVG